MLRYKALFVGLTLAAAGLAYYATRTVGPLTGMILVIDPGHGGTDPGAHGFFNNGSRVRVAENEYCYDVALRLEKIVKAKGGHVIFTVRDRKNNVPVATDPRVVLVDNQDEYFTLDGSQARAGKSGLQRRVDVVEQARRKYGKEAVVFVSIHFDKLGTNGDLAGVHLVAPKGKVPSLCEYLLDEYRQEGRLLKKDGAEYFPLKQSGNKAHGMRNIHVLNACPVPQAVLVELGNFNNPSDVWRLRDYRVRENYAQIMVRALLRLKEG